LFIKSSLTLQKKITMDFHISFKVNERLYVRNPESSDLGKQIVKNAIDLIYTLGFEHFTFKKLATEISTTEASIYRYFENKHRLLLYILNWYWCYMDFLVLFRLQNMNDSKLKLQTIIDLLTHELPASTGQLDYNKLYLTQIVIAESSKSYLVKEVNEINKDDVFKPYKDLCATIAAMMSEYNPNYQYPYSLSSTLIEASHQQQFFANHLPRLTDIKKVAQHDFVTHFLQNMVFKVLD
jgi:AcrR family transcriptional regulator